MIESSPKVDYAFQQLVAALNAEIAEFKKVGADIFHSGAPRHAQALLRRANDHESLQQQVAALHERWKSGILSPTPPPTYPPPASYLKLERSQPGLIRNIKGMTTAQAAKMLGVPPRKVVGWLEAGTLKGYQKVGGTWKITKADLVTFSRDHRDLLVSAPE
jgi:excisionase family DNA binding protein